MTSSLGSVLLSSGSVVSVRGAEAVVNTVRGPGEEPVIATVAGDAGSTEQPFMAAPPTEFPGGPNEGESETRFHLRPRRRRRPRTESGGNDADGAPVAETNSAE